MEKQKYLIIKNPVDYSRSVNVSKERNNWINESMDIAHTYGNVSAIVTEYIKNLFPINYFKTFHVGSKVSFKEFDFRNNSKKEFFRKTKPILVVRPRVLTDGAEDRFLGNTLLTTNFTNNYFSEDGFELQPFFRDTEKNIECKYLMNRLAMQFEVYVATETHMETINLYNMLVNKLRQQKSFFIYTALESAIPERIIDLISEASEIPREDTNGSGVRFNNYLNSYSYYPITYKLKGSSGNLNHFMYHQKNLETVVSEISVSENTKRGMRSDRSEMTFAINVDFFAPAVFFFYSGKKVTNNKPYYPSNEYFNVYSLSNACPNITLPEGFNIYFSSIFLAPESTEDPVYEISINDMIDPKLSTIIKYFKNHELNLSSLLHFVIMKNNDVINESDFSINWDSLSVEVKNIDDRCTYRLVIYVNQLYLNSLIKDIYDIEEKINKGSINENTIIHNKDFVYNDNDITRSPGIKYDVNMDINDQPHTSSLNNDIEINKKDWVFIATSKIPILTDKDIINQSKLEIESNSDINYSFDENDKGDIIVAVPDNWCDKVRILINREDMTNKFKCHNQNIKIKENIFGSDRFKLTTVNYKIYRMESDDNSNKILNFIIEK